MGIPWIWMVGLWQIGGFLYIENVQLASTIIENNNFLDIVELIFISIVRPI